MDSKIINKKEDREPKKEETQSVEIKNTNPKKNKLNEEDQYRVVISKEANDALETMTKRTNEGFDGGEVTKSDIANLVLVGSTKSFSDADIKNLRNLHFNERKMLRALLRKSGDEGDLPEEIKKALREHYGLAEQSRKRNSKNHSELSTEKFVDNSSAA